jgi:hypothetical protein
MSSEHSNVIYLNQAQLKKPCFWTYVLRDRENNIVIRGQGHTRNACQRQAMLQASEHSEKLCILEAIIRCSPKDLGWRFVVTPPSCQRGARQWPRPFRPSEPQLHALILGLSHSSPVIRWVGAVRKACKTVTSFACLASPPSMRCGIGIFSMQTVLIRRSPTLNSNTDELEGISGLQVWTSDLGIETLQNEGMLVLREQL